MYLCALTKNDISHKLRLAMNRGISKSMLEKELNESGRNQKLVCGPESSDEESEASENPPAQPLPVCDICFGTCRPNFGRSAEPLLSCFECGISFHPSCLRYSQAPGHIQLYYMLVFLFDFICDH